MVQLGFKVLEPFAQDIKEFKRNPEKNLKNSLCYRFTRFRFLFRELSGLITSTKLAKKSKSSRLKGDFFQSKRLAGFCNF